MTRNIRIILYILISTLAITFSSTMIIFAAVNASNETNFTISFASPYAYLKEGNVVNAKIKELASGAPTTYTSADANITKVVFDEWDEEVYGSIFDWDTSTSVVLDENDYGLIKGFYNSEDQTIYILSERIICPVDLSDMFYKCQEITEIDFDNFNTVYAQPTDMSYMFYNCESLSTLTNNNNLDTSTITNMAYAFANCDSLTSFNLASYNTKNVTDMSGLLSGCTALTTFTSAGSDTSKVTTYENFFNECSNLSSISLTGISTNNAISLESMFEGCISLSSVDVSGFNTTKVENYNKMFKNCTGLTSLDISSFNVKSGATGTAFIENSTNIDSIVTPATTGGSLVVDNANAKFYIVNGSVTQNQTAVTSITASNCATTKTIRRGYVFVFDVNGGVAISNKAYTYGETIDITTTRTGYTFNGWYTTESNNNGTGDQYTTCIKEGNNISTKTLYAKWTAKQYTVTFNKNNGEGGSSSVTATYGSAMPSITIPTRTGYTFGGYTYSGAEYYSAQGASEKLYDIDDNITLTAQWNPISYTVVYNGNGETGGATSSSSHIYDQTSALSANGFTRTGYDFVVWTTNQDGTGTQYTSGQSVNNLSSTNGDTITLYAQWIGKDYSIVTTLSEGAESCLVAESSKYNAQLEFSWTGKEDYNFTNVIIYGRPTANSSSGEVELLRIIDGNNSTFTMNGTYYPQIRIEVNYELAIVIYNITYNFQNGTGGTATAQAVYGDIMPEVVYPTRTGYTFTGYNSSSTTITPERAGYETTYRNFRVEYPIAGLSNGAHLSMSIQFDTVPTGVSFNNVSLTNSGDWTCIPLEGGGSLNIIEHTLTQSETSGLIALWRSLEFGGVSSTVDWIILTNNRGGYLYYTQNGPQRTMDVEEDLTLYAQWIENPYFVHYNANNGSGSMSDSTHYYDTSSKITANAFTRTGYTFKNWNTKADGSGTTYTNTQSVSRLTAQYGGVVTLYAQWTPITYTVTYNANGGSGTVSNTTHTYDQASALSSQAFTAVYYDFIGWNTKTDGSGTSYSLGQSVVNLSSTQGDTITLYANWRQKSTAHRVTFDANAGRGIMPAMTSQTFTGNNMTIEYDAENHIFTLRNSSPSDPFATIGTPINFTGGQTYIVHMAIYDTNYNPVQSGSIQMFYAINGAYSEAQSVRFSASKQIIAFTPPTTGDYLIRLDNDTGIEALIIDFWFITYYEMDKLVLENATYGDLPSPSRPGYTFNGWYTQKEGGTQILSNSVFNLKTDQTLYAHWQAPQYYTVNFNANGGTASFSSKSIQFDTQYGELPTATHANDDVGQNYQFVGWFTDKNGGTQITSTSVFATVGGTTLYAHWTYTPKTYTVTLSGSVFVEGGDPCSSYDLTNTATGTTTSMSKNQSSISLTGVTGGTVVTVKVGAHGYWGWGTYVNSSYSGASNCSNANNPPATGSYWILGSSEGKQEAWKLNGAGTRLVSKSTGYGWCYGYVTLVVRSDVTISVSAGRA